MKILIIAEQESRQLKDSTRSVLAGARQIGEPIEVLLAGSCAPETIDQACRLPGVSRVIVVTDPDGRLALAENLSSLVASLAPGYSHVLTVASGFGKNWLPRVAAVLDCGMVSDVVRIEGPTVFTRPIYAGSVWATVESVDPIQFLTLRVAAFEALAGEAEVPAPWVEGEIPAPVVGVVKVGETRHTGDGRPSLENARTVVSGGRGLGSAEQFKAILEPLADKLGAALGASRAAVDLGYVPNECQVGQTGKIVAPELYIAVGISGAIQHLAGMKESRVIVAINKDPEAPIFEVADYGLVGDLHQLVPALTAAL